MCRALLPLRFTSFYLEAKLLGPALSFEANMTETLISYKDEIYWTNLVNNTGLLFNTILFESIIA